MTFDYSIVIPAFQEAGTLSKAVEELVSFCANEPERVEIFIVENGSTDTTWEVARSLSGRFPDVRALQSAKKGKGSAILLGWSVAKAPIVMFLDADLSPHPSVLPHLYKIVLKNGGCAVADRFLKTSRVSRSLKRKTLSRLWALAVSATLPIPFMDYQCGAKALRREDAEACAPLIQAHDWLFDLELLLCLRRRGGVMERVPVLWRETVFPGRRSHLPLLRTSVRFLLSLPRLRRG